MDCRGRQERWNAYRLLYALYRQVLFYFLHIPLPSSFSICAGASLWWLWCTVTYWATERLVPYHYPAI